MFKFLENAFQWGELAQGELIEVWFFASLGFVLTVVVAGVLVFYALRIYVRRRIIKLEFKWRKRVIKLKAQMDAIRGKVLTEEYYDVRYKLDCARKKWLKYDILIRKMEYKMGLDLYIPQS